MKRIEGMIACVAITGALVYAPAQKLLCNLESGLHKHVQAALLRGEVPQVPPVADFSALPQLPNAIAVSRSAPPSGSPGKDVHAAGKNAASTGPSQCRYAGTHGA